MFVPHHFHLEDREAIAEILRDFNFALLVTAGPEGLEATHLPLLHEPDTKGQGFGRLLGHLARGNGQCRAMERLAEAGGEALAVFQGPHAYVSPTWYGDNGPATVPTWNYLAVHIYGQPRLHTEPEATESILKKLASRQESSLPEPWTMERMDAAQITRMRRGVLAFELPIGRLEAKAKLSQNRTAEQRRSLEGEWRGANHDDSRALAAWMERLRGELQ